MDQAKIAELEAATAAAKTAAEAAGGTDEALNKAVTDAEAALAQAKEPLQADPIKTELERVQKQGRTEAEKATFTLKKNAERAKQLGIDPAQVLGLGDKEVDKSAPVTVGMLEEIEKNRAQKSALQLADTITDENERELTKHYLSTRIVPSEDPAADLKLARGMVNSVKNAQILEEEARRTGAKGHSSGPGAPQKKNENAGELTATEIPYMKAPWNMTKEAIIAARPKS